MPKKTRQQKILTELRALRNQVQPENPSQSPVSPKPPKVVMTSPGSASTNYSYVIKDLKKVAILATICFLIEIVLSLTLNLGFAKLIPGIS
jgi:hypothetical protein